MNNQDQHFLLIFNKIQKMKRIVSLFLSVVSILSTLIPCEYVSPNWTPFHGYPLSQREMVVPTRYGFDMIIDPIDQTVSKAIKDQGMWQPSIAHLSAYFIKPNFKVLNLGSQTGLQAILMGKLILPSGQLFIFEPYSVSYNIVRKNVHLNDLENITEVYQVGASDIQTRAQMIIEAENTGGAEIFLSNIPQVDRQSRMQQEVSVDLIDEVLPSNLTIDFVLMDVEKMEVQALLGMKKLIERSRDIIILLEWQYSANSKRNQAKTIRLLKWLEQKQFKIYKYIENELNKCSIGSFEQIKSVYQLLTLPVLDILMVPSHIDPNHYLQI